MLMVAQVVANGLVGFLFQRLLAWRFGLSVEKSAFDIAFSVPFTVVYLSGLAMAHTVIVAYFNRIRSRDSASRSESFSAILNISLLLIITMVIVGLINVESLTRMLAPGFSSTEQLILMQLVQILLLLAMPIGAGMLLSAASFASGIPMSQEFLLLVARVLVILVAVSAPGLLSTVADISVFLVLCSSVLILLQAALLCRSTGLRWVPSIRMSAEDRAWLVSRLSGFLLIAVFAQAAALYYRSEGTRVSAEFVAAIGFAVSVIEPLGTAFGRVIVFYGARKYAHAADHLDNRVPLDQVLRSVTMAGLSGAAVAVLITLASQPLVTLLYGGGEITAMDLRLIADTVAVYCWTLPASAASWAMLTVSISQSKYNATAVYVSGYFAQIAYLWVMGPGLDGSQLLQGFLIPVWWQAVALTATVITTSNRSKRF